MSRRVLLYTEMVVATALVRGSARHLLAFDCGEHPVALQLGGSDPAELGYAARMASDEGYAEVNLNVGCPSDRVQSGCFGAVLMKRPALVADCAAAMIAAVPRDVEVTVKCRIGVDDQSPGVVLPEFLHQIRQTGVRRVQIHARKAWLQGLSPKENRDVPPLDYDLVVGMKTEFPDMHISVNGGITELSQARAMLASGMDGVMIGRAAYHRPYDILANADAIIFSDTHRPFARSQVVETMSPYISNHLRAGGRLNQVTRHMLGLFAGQPGARAWRRMLSDGAHRPGAGLDLLHDALSAASDVKLAMNDASVRSRALVG